MKTFQILLILRLLVTTALAHNNLFLPDDSYFGSVIPEDGLVIEEDDHGAVFDYRAFSGTFMLCGYAGYGQLKLLDIPESFLKNIKKAESLEHRKITEAKVLLYDRGFDFERFSIGLKYNENWAENQRRAGKDHFIYNGFENPDMILLDWQDAERVSSLSIERAPPLVMYQAIERGKGKNKTTGFHAQEPQHPVRLKFDKCMVILVWDDLEALASKEAGTGFQLIYGDELRQFTYAKDEKGNFNHLVETTEASSASH